MSSTFPQPSKESKARYRLEDLRSKELQIGLELSFSEDLDHNGLMVCLLIGIPTLQSSRNKGQKTEVQLDQSHRLESETGARD